MKNKTLAIGLSGISYVKELRPITGSVSATILMQRLDYWFEKYPDGFYKFLEPCDHSACIGGDSWTEELGFSKDEFRAAFAKIGTHHKSKSIFTKSPDPFEGKFYCSYHDRVKGMVYYRRNHELTDRALDEVFGVEPATLFKVNTTASVKPPKPRSPGFIYLAYRPSLGIYKIGLTRSVESRLMGLISNAQDRIEILHSFYVLNMGDAEDALHERFSVQQIEGEWFNLTSEDVAHIKAKEDESQNPETIATS